MDKYLNEDAITAEIMSYVKNRIYNYAVLIDGDWGTGKTYFIQKSIIPTLEGSGYMPIYISLYGVNSTDTVSQKIALSILTNKLPSDKRTVAKQCLPAIGSFVLPIGQTLLNATGISILEPFFKSPVEDIPWDTIFKKFNDSRKRIFIFDDLERCSLPINEILGYINSLVEHESEKVLIVANQQAIGKMSLRNDLEAKYQVVLNPQLHLTEKVRKVSQSYFTSQDKLADQHITEFTPDQLRQHTAELFSENVLYKEIKEKLVGQELYFRPTLEKTLPCIIDESSLDDEVKEVLTQSLDKILNVFQQENCLNLRSFQAALLTLIRIWNLPFDKSINPLDRQQLLEDLFVAILHGTLIAQALGVPESVIALTFVALGTSLPELVTAITSLIKGHSDLSVGNVVGANVFNLVLVSGVSVTLAPFTIPQSSTLFGVNSSLVLDLPVMLAVMLIMTVPALVKGKMNRAQGIILLAIYAAFCAIQFTM